MERKQWEHKQATLAAVETAGREVTSLEIKIMRVKKERNTAIREASNAGNSAIAISNVAHLTVDMCYKLIRVGK